MQKKLPLFIPCLTAVYLGPNRTLSALPKSYIILHKSTQTSSTWLLQCSTPKLLIVLLLISQLVVVSSGYSRCVCLGVGRCFNLIYLFSQKFQPCYHLFFLYLALCNAFYDVCIYHGSHNPNICLILSETKRIVFLPKLKLWNVPN